MFGVYVYFDQKKISENLQNFDSSGGVLGIDYQNIYSYLTTNEEENPIQNEINESGTYSKNYFSSNLIEKNVSKDFQYFNNSTSIFTGYKYKT